MSAILGLLLVDNRVGIMSCLTARKKILQDYTLIITLFALRSIYHLMTLMSPPKLRRSIRAKRLLQSYTRYSRARATFVERCRKRRRRIQPDFRRRLRDDLRSMSSEVKLLSNNIFELLQPESLDEDILGASFEDSSEDSSDGLSDGDSSDGDPDWIYENVDKDISMSDAESDDDSAFADDEFDTADGDDSDSENDTCPTPFRTQIFNDLKRMYTHRYETPHKRVPKPRAPFMKHVLEELKDSRPDLFRAELRVSPLAFDHLIEAIKNDPVFIGRSKLSPQAPVKEQLAVALYRFGHNGNAASLQSIANWAGIGKGTVELYTRRVMTAFLQPEFMRGSVHWPDEEEKEAAKQWVQDHSCKAWRNGWCFVDGTLVPLASRPYWYGESYFDRKCRYSLNVQVCLHLLLPGLMVPF